MFAIVVKSMKELIESTIRRVTVTVLRKGVQKLFNPLKPIVLYLIH